MRFPVPRAALAAPIALVALLLAGCGRGDDAPVQVTVIDSAAPALADPYNGPLSPARAVAMEAMAQGLVRFDGRGEIAPGLAERWNVSDDGLSYIFRLAKGSWSNGRKVNARDVARALKRQLRGGSRNPLKDTLGAVDDVVAMTDRVIEVRLTAPRPNLLQLLAQPEFGVLHGGLGAGPMTRDAERDGPGLPLTYRFQITDAPDLVDHATLRSASAVKAIAAFKSGGADLVLGGTVADLPLAREARPPRGALRFDPVAGLFGLVPLRSSGPAGDPEVRRLLALAIDRDALIRDLGVPGLVARTTILQAGLDGIAAPPPSALPPLDGDRAAALAAAGRRQFGALDRPTLRIRLPDGPGGDLLLSRLQADWGALGLTVERAGAGEPADFGLVDQVAPTTSPAWFVRSFRCGVAAVCVAEADELMDSARATLVADQRGAMLAEAARLLDARTAFIALAAPIRWSLVGQGLPGFTENKVARHPLIGLKRKPSPEGQ